MNKTLPDKWVRKAVYDEVNNIVVSGKTIPCYDTRITGRTIPQHYILMTTQTNLVDKANKCEWFWDSSILLDIITTYKSSGNTGSRLLADNIADAVRAKINNVALSVSSGLEIITKTQSYPNDISTITTNENIFRKLIRLEMLIK
jgi:hypothetical protein